jgi:predicted nucleotidyltransferase
MDSVFIDSNALLEAADLLRNMGATQVFVFGSAIRGEVRSDSDVDLAVTGLPSNVYFFRS